VIKEIKVNETSSERHIDEERNELIEQIIKDFEMARTKLTHPHLVQYLGIQYSSNTLYIFREYVSFFFNHNIHFHFI
jgi:hypothetical protein